MLLPDEVHSSARAAVYARLRAGPCWSLLKDGVLHVHQLGPGDIEDYIAALERCAVVVARRRHESWYGPVVGFELKPAGAIVALEFDIDPLAEGKLTTWVTSGVAAAVEWLRWRHPHVGTFEVPGVTQG